MPTVTKRVPLDELPADWREDFEGSALVEVRLTSVPDAQSEEDKRLELKDIIDGIKPVKPAADYPGSVGAIRRMREERLQRITNPDA